MNKKIKILGYLICISIIFNTFCDAIELNDFSSKNKEKKNIICTSKNPYCTNLETITKYKSKTIFVGKNSNLTNISDALKIARDGDRIIVFPGRYHEHLLINKSVKIIGEGEVIIDGDFNSTVIKITADKVYLENLQITNSGGGKKDVLLKIFSKHNIIARCRFYNSRIGVLLQSDHNTIVNCTFGRDAIAIKLRKSEENNISSSSFRNCGIGVYLNNSHKNVLRELFFIFDGISILFEKSNQNFLINATVVYGNENQGGVCLDKSNYNRLINILFYGNGFCIRSHKSNYNLIENINFTSNKQALDLIKSQANEIIRCKFSKNNLGLYSDNSYNNVVHSSNFFRQKSYAILAKNSILDARFNYWNQKFRPKIVGKGEKILNALSLIKFFPWLLNPYPLSPSKPDFTLPEIPSWRRKWSIGNDSDMDGCSDEWERRWGYDPFSKDNHSLLDPDIDGLPNTDEEIAEKWGANPFKKDIFIEIDWMDRSYKLKDIYKKKLKELFEKHNITLHLDDGTLGGGEKIKKKEEITYPDLVDIYWDYFLHGNPNNPRKYIFRYVLLCPNMPANLAGGFCFVGWNTIDSFAIAVDFNRKSLPRNWADYVTATVLLHELGHTLGLFYYKFEGIDNYTCQYLLPGVWKFRNYKSCMNYAYTWFLLDYSNGGHGKNDFNDWNNIDLGFFRRETWGATEKFYH